MDGRISSIRDPISKRLFDVLFTLTGAVVALPLAGLIAALIWLEDGRPIFFRQERIGKGGKLFRLYKFRSMDSNSSATEIQATSDDPRITRIGRLLRKTALDEMPQLWNIFLGDVSVVGPRAQPEVEIVSRDGHHTEIVIRQIPGFARRSAIRPGLTGVSQMFAPRDVPHHQKFRYDLIYVRRIEKSTGLRGNLAILFYDLGLILVSFWNTATGRWEV